MSKKDKKIFCEVCKKEIDKKLDNYAHILEYTLGKFVKEGYFHRICFNESLNKVRLDKASQQLMDLAQGLSARANVMLDQAGVDKVYTIK